jgi:glycosyltransferase involved in cell wall biosynthesis
MKNCAQPKEDKIIAAIIPAFNEATRIEKAIIDATPFVDHIVVVDDCSHDQTRVSAHKVGAIVLRHPINQGQGAALQTGMDFAINHLKADFLIHFDADGQMRGDDIPKMLAPLVLGEADITLGSRFLGNSENMPFSRRVTLNLGILFTRLISGINLTDTHNGFRALNRIAASKIRIKLNRMAHASEILDQIIFHKLRFKEVPVTIRYSEETLRKGQSSLGALTILKDFLMQKFFIV